MQDLNTRISHDKSNIKLPENRKLNVSKYLYECSNGIWNNVNISNWQLHIISNKRKN